jgi:lysozyme
VSIDADTAPAKRRRWLAGVVAALLLLGAALAGWWLLWVPHSRPSLRSGEVYGIDVSNHQGHINWPQVAADEIEFAYIKATEGGDHTDARFAENWAGAGVAGVRRGPYHFFTLCRPGLAQAEHFLRVAPPDSEALPPAVDLELAGNCKARPDGGSVQAELDAFLERVEAAWQRPMLLYVGDDWEARYPVLDRSGRPRWLVSFFGRPDLEWTVWQLHGFAKVDGIGGRVDLDVAELCELRARQANQR